MNLSHSFRSALFMVYGQIAERKPSQIEIAVAEALQTAFTRSQQIDGLMRAVTGATGSGKSQAAIALAYSLLPASSALVIREIAEVQKAFETLNALVPGQVAVYTSIHKDTASPYEVAAFEQEFNVKVTQRFTEDEFRAAPIVICTHARWKNEIESGKDRGVRLYKGHQRDVIIVDEDPDLEKVYVIQPEHVSELASILTDTVRPDEARAFGFTKTHPAVDNLTAIHARMRDVKDRVDVPQLYAQEDLLTAEDIASIAALRFKEDILDRLVAYSGAERTAKADFMWQVVEFLRAAAEGRVFYSKFNGGAFHAYSFAIPPQRNTILLDGTADINGMYAVGGGIVTVETVKPIYDRTSLNILTLPDEMKGKIRPNSLLKNSWSAEPLMVWFKEALLANTSAGEEILVYTKKDLLNYGLHLEGDESGRNDPYYCEWEGRKIHWSSFGRGRGSNKWKDCTVYFRLGDFYPQKAIIVAKLGSLTGDIYSPDDYRRLSSGTTTDPLYLMARDTHLLVNHKQDAARTCIRNLDDDGRAQAARLYMIGAHLPLLVEHRERLFPGSPEWTLIDAHGNHHENPKVWTGGTGPERLAEFLMRNAEKPYHTAKEIYEASGIKSNNIDQALSSPKVAPIVASLSLRKGTRKEAGLKKKGYVLMKDAA